MEIRLNKSIITTIILMVMAIFLIGCNETIETTTFHGYIPSFKIIGDLEEILLINDMKDFSIVEIDVKGEKRSCLTLQELIDNTKPVTKEYELLLVGQDGLMAKIDGKGIEECYIGFSDENAWEFINLRHPVSSNIKKIKEVVVISKNENWDYGLNIINTEENIMNIKPGSLYSMNSSVFPYFEGNSSIKNQGNTYETSIYTEQKILKIKDLISLSEGEKILAMGALGEYKWIDEESYLKMVDNKIDLIEKEGKNKIEDVRGIFLNPTKGSIMDTYYDASYFLENEEKVLILFIDGFGYHQYLHAINNSYAPFLQKIKTAEKVTTVYQPVTNAGFATMITGKPPHENGVYSRKQRDLKVPSIFAAAENLKKSSILIEGDIKILNTEIEPILNTDRNKNGLTDDEVFESALENFKNDYDLMMIHFHGIDDMGHDNGDLHKKTMERISIIDGYIEELVKGWEGKVIITSDHGMHNTAEGGEHGSFRYEDMVVPYILMEGGDKE